MGLWLTVHCNGTVMGLWSTVHPLIDDHRDAEAMAGEMADHIGLLRGLGLGLQCVTAAAG